MKLSSKLKRRFVTILIAIVIVLSVISVSTFAWYIYNTNAHTTDVHMAAGAGANIKISSSADGAYGQSAVLDSFVGELAPVSTNSILGGFQKIFGYSDKTTTIKNIKAALFTPSEKHDYYQTSLFLRNDDGNVDVYIADIGFEDSSKKDPISTAIRVGLITHLPGENQPVDKEFIFEINTDKNPEHNYNTATGKEGYVLDCTKNDGTTVPFKPYSPANYCSYDNNTGNVTLSADSTLITKLIGGKGEAKGEPVQVDIYIWLEGCDEDCYNNLAETTLKNLAISFAGVPVEN